jgi:hypothetical protein
MSTSNKIDVLHEHWLFCLHKVQNHQGTSQKQFEYWTCSLSLVKYLFLNNFRQIYDVCLIVSFKTMSPQITMLLEIFKYQLLIIIPYITNVILMLSVSAAIIKIKRNLTNFKTLVSIQYEWTNTKFHVFLCLYPQDIEVIFSTGTYAYLVELVFVFLLTDLLRYKPVIVLDGIFAIITWSLLIWGKSMLQMQVMIFCRLSWFILMCQ